MKKGFTLIELAIVLVIVGLLVSGTLAGQELVEQARLSNFVTKLSRTNLAATTFKSKYGALPGDFNRATLIWGQRGDCLSITNDILSQPETCNGNNDGAITWGLETTIIEPIFFWQQLHNSELLTGMNVEEVGPGGGNFAYGLKTNYNDIYITVAHASSDHDSSYGFDTFIPNQTFVLGRLVDDSFVAEDPIIKPTTAQRIDAKLDDGRPSTGVVRGGTDTGYLPSMKCEDGSSPPEYNITDDTDVCAMIVKADF